MAKVAEGWDIPVNFQKAPMVTRRNGAWKICKFFSLYQNALYYTEYLALSKLTNMQN